MSRKTFIVHTDDVEVYKEEEHIENYNAKIYMTREGYFKKITLQSLRGNDEQKLKDGDRLGGARASAEDDFGGEDFQDDEDDDF